jgi:hypothetical protein
MGIYQMTLLSVPLARARAGATMLSAGDKGISDTYLGMVYDQGTDRRAYIKDIARIELANELLGSTLAKGLGLPTVDPHLVLVNTALLPFTKGPQMPNPDMRLAFATADGRLQKIVTRISSAGLPAAEIRAWSYFAQVICFDEWIANYDRHPGNLLFGDPDRFLLIDHGHAFTGPNWTISSLIANQNHSNQLLEGWGKSAIDGALCSRIVGALSTMLSEIDCIDLDYAVECSRVDTFLSDGETVALVNFLRERRLYIKSSLPRKLGSLGLVP